MTGDIYYVSMKNAHVMRLGADISFRYSRHILYDAAHYHDAAQVIHACKCCARNQYFQRWFQRVLKDFAFDRVKRGAYADDLDFFRLMLFWWYNTIFVSDECYIHYFQQIVTCCSQLRSLRADFAIRTQTCRYKKASASFQRRYGLRWIESLFFRWGHIHSS